MTQAEFDQLKPGDVVVLAPPDMIDVAERHRIAHVNVNGAGEVRSIVYYTEISDASIVQRAEEPPVK